MLTFYKQHMKNTKVSAMTDIKTRRGLIKHNLFCNSVYNVSDTPAKKGNVILGEE